nr:hypothetical protein [Tanacetum cinerariifolium]
TLRGSPRESREAESARRSERPQKGRHRGVASTCSRGETSNSNMGGGISSM